MKSRNQPGDLDDAGCLCKATHKLRKNDAKTGAGDGTGTVTAMLYPSSGRWAKVQRLDRSAIKKVAVQPRQW